MSDQVKFFNTQIDMKRSKKEYVSNSSFNASLKVRKLDRVYTKALSQKIRTQKSINSLHKNAQKVRIDFLKFYENKKAKLLNKQKVQNYMISSKQHSTSVYRKTKQRKLMDEYQMLTTKNEEQESNLAKQEKNKKDKEKLQKEIKIKNLEAFMFAKEQYQKIKDERESLTERNKKIAQILQMRSHYNYRQKMEKQLEYIHCYEELLKQVEENQEIMDEIRPSTTASKSFFITTRRINSTKQSRDIHTSQTAR